MNKNQLVEKIKNDSDFTISCLLYLYKDVGGVRCSDFKILSGIAKQVERKNDISEKQLRLLKRKLPKYHKQLINAYQTNNLKDQIKIRIKNKIAIKNKKIVSKLTEKTLLITYPYDESLNAKIKLNIYGRTFSKPDKGWKAPITYDSIKYLIDIGFQLTSEINEIWNKWKPKKITIEKLLPLYPFQHKGLEWLQSVNGRGILADEMGLGKTIQILAWLFHNPKIRPVLIAMTAGAKLVWRDELKKWLPGEDIQVIYGRGDHKIEESICLINFDIIFDTEVIKKKKDGKLIEKKIGIPRKFLTEIPFKAVILDEAHNLSSENSFRTQAVKELVKKTPHLIAATGTPIKNRPIELFPLLNMIDPAKWPSKWIYAKNFCDLSYNGFGWDYSGSSNEDQLNEKLQGTMLRRLKEDYLTELPKKIRTIIPIELNKTDELKYRKKENELIHGLDESSDGAKQLSIIEKLKQLAIDFKLKYILKWIDNYLTQNKKLVVFSHHRHVVNLINDYYQTSCTTVIGGCSAKKRLKAVEAFQKDPSIKIFNGSIKACKEAITLTAASATLTTEFLWEPKDHEQAEDRVHRIGSEHDSIQAFYPVLDNSIEMKIAELLDSKIKNISKIIDGRPAETEDLFTTLIKTYKGHQKAF